ncbi:alpha/beta fold hydrolase [Ralstonia chuxiongensis]|uniref:Alpha/beta hydrolase n=1 Tax=Ralstonia chuxiongensis TaxID=2957504 RepID=A0AA41WZA1_9RALS|nr:alpha/beta hydrolase [Ralstonia chuxiongensis]MCP1175644.1 alpha/beta hydrolase [Ralstonia chuxiongensis]
MSQKTPVTLVLLPGMDGTGRLFQPLLAEMGEGIVPKVLTYPESEPLPYAALIPRIQAELKAIDGPYVVLGESFSGPLAIEIAASCPPGMMGLILCCTFARNPHPRLRPLGFALNLLPFNDVITRIGSRLLFGRFFTQPLHRMFLQAVNTVAPAVFRARLRSVLEVDVTDKLAAVQVPLLYLQGAEDNVVPRSAASLVQQVRPDMQLVTMDAPHCLLQAVPREAACVIGTFIAAAAERFTASQVKYAGA